MALSLVALKAALLASLSALFCADAAQFPEKLAGWEALALSTGDGMLAVTYATEASFGVCLSAFSALYRGLRPVVLGWGKFSPDGRTGNLARWHRINIDKFTETARFVRWALAAGAPRSMPVLAYDGGDTVVVRDGPSCFLDGFRARNFSALFAAEEHFYVGNKGGLEFRKFGFLEEAFPPPELPFGARYLNGGGYMGRAETLLAMYDGLIEGLADLEAPATEAILGFKAQGLPVYVSEVRPGFWAERNGVRMDDELVEVNGKAAGELAPEDLARTLAASGPLRLRFRREGTVEFRGVRFSTENVNDQALLALYVAKSFPALGGNGDLALDAGASLFECMFGKRERGEETAADAGDFEIREDGSVANVHTGTRPCMVHFNGDKAGWTRIKEIATRFRLDGDEAARRVANGTLHLWDAERGARPVPFAELCPDFQAPIPRRKPVQRHDDWLDLAAHLTEM